MREHEQPSGQVTDILRCNCCGQVIEKVEKLNRHVDYLYVEKAWSYFSSKDLSQHRFNICETCYDRFIETFIIPAEEISVTEVFKCIEEISEMQSEEVKKK